MAESVQWGMEENGELYNRLRKRRDSNVRGNDSGGNKMATRQGRKDTGRRGGRVRRGRGGVKGAGG